MDEKTARKYLRAGKLPSEMMREHTWRTREDPFAEVWSEAKAFLELNAGLEAKTIFEYLQRKYPGEFSDGQLRTFQRKVKHWRATEGPPREVYFAQEHHPGHLCQSDFTHMEELGITIGNQPFDHLVYHFVLTYSNWESGTVCFSESMEGLSIGFQDALWRLGGVPHVHQTDRMTAAVHRPGSPEEFTQRYQALMNHYQITARKIQARMPNENGDVEQRHHRFKRALDQSLILRGSREFSTQEEYEAYLQQLFIQLNRGRTARLEEEREHLQALPERRLESCKRLGPIRVSSGSLIQVQGNSYSVHSRLIGEHVSVRLYARRVDVWYGGRCIERIPRVRGKGNHRVQYRHVIDSLIRKPGAFENYRYRADMFPTSRFRRAYDELKRRHTLQVASREYLANLKLACDVGELMVDRALRALLAADQTVDSEAVHQWISDHKDEDDHGDVDITDVDLQNYDDLLEAVNA
jgi:hypothetical protein